MVSTLQEPVLNPEKSHEASLGLDRALDQTVPDQNSTWARCRALIARLEPKHLDCLKVSQICSSPSAMHRRAAAAGALWHLPAIEKPTTRSEQIRGLALPGEPQASRLSERGSPKQSFGTTPSQAPGQRLRCLPLRLARKLPCSARRLLCSASS